MYDICLLIWQEDKCIASGTYQDKTTLCFFIHREHSYIFFSNKILQSPIFAILCMYKRQRARVGDLSHFGVSHTQWVRVGSPVMFNQ